MNNGFEEVYVNAAVNDGSDIAELMQIFTNDNAYNNEKFPVTSGSKHRYKETEEGQEIMCDIMEKIRTETKNDINTLIRELVLTPTD